MKVDLYSEEDIINGCQHGKRLYQELLYRQHAKKMYAICISYATDRSLAQDILQESFIKVFRNINNYKGTGSLEGWIRRIVVNTSIDHLRQNSRANLFINNDAAESMVYTENEALPCLHFNEILELIARLPDGAKAIFNLFALEGYSHKEIAEKLDISVGTSKSQYNRARGILKGWIGNIPEK